VIQATAGNLNRVRPTAATTTSRSFHRLSSRLESGHGSPASEGHLASPRCRTKSPRSGPLSICTRKRFKRGMHLASAPGPSRPQCGDCPSWKAVGRQLDHRIRAHEIGRTRGGPACWSRARPRALFSAQSVVPGQRSRRPGMRHSHDQPNRSGCGPASLVGRVHCG